MSKKSDAVQSEQLNMLRKKLVFLYTTATGLILTAVFIIAFFLNKTQTVTLSEEKFNSCAETLIGKIAEDISISDLWLTEYELNNKLAVKISDAGEEIFFKGTNITPTSRAELVALAEKEAVALNSAALSKPISVTSLKSELFYIDGKKSDKYIACTATVAYLNSYRTLVAVQYLPELTYGLARLRVIYILLDVAGITLLYLLSRFIISRTLKPVSESRRRQNEFIAAASHELKSPLAVIRAQNSSFDRSSDSAKSIIESECRRMSKLIEDMLLLASCDTGEWTIQSEEVDTEKLLTDVYEMYMPLARSKNIEIRFALPEQNLPKVIGEQQRLVQLFSVLADNAVSYSPNGSEVEISARLDEDNVYISVTDQGCGISEADREHIFERFYRSDRSRSDKAHFGLGLSIANELAQRMGGEITLQTGDNGSTFTVRLRQKR